MDEYTKIPVTFEVAVKEVVRELAETVITKQHDYGKANILDFGEFGIMVRANDKFARLKELITKGKEAQNEPKTDTWKDIAGYAILALMLERGWFELPMGDK